MSSSAAQKLFSIGNASATNESLVFADNCIDFLKRCDTEYVKLDTGATLSQRDFGKTILVETNANANTSLVIPDTSKSVGAKFDLLYVNAVTALTASSVVTVKTADLAGSSFTGGVLGEGATTDGVNVLSGTKGINMTGVQVGSKLQFVCDGKTWFVHGIVKTAQAAGESAVAIMA